MNICIYKAYRLGGHLTQGGNYELKVRYFYYLFCCFTRHAYAKLKHTFDLQLWQALYNLYLLWDTMLFLRHGRASLRAVL